MISVLSRMIAWASRAAVAVLVLIVRGYQAAASPLLGQCCRYAPSCSQYTIEALRVHGVVRGAILAAWRILRCHPFSRSGYDPVPPRRAAGNMKSGISDLGSGN
jgi:putative membrane protein insertion efficiency factor